MNEKAAQQAIVGPRITSNRATWLTGFLLWARRKIGVLMGKIEARSQSNDHVLAEYCEMLKTLRLVPRLVSSRYFPVLYI